MTMTFEGYVASITIDDELGVLHGEVINTRDVLTFSAKDVPSLKEAFADTIADYRAWCAAEGVEPEKPYSGTVSLRLGGELHQCVAIRAAQEHVSINTLIVQMIECGLGKRAEVVTREDLNLVRDEVVKVVRQTSFIGGAEEQDWQGSSSQKLTIQ